MIIAQTIRSWNVAANAPLFGKRLAFLIAFTVSTLILPFTGQAAGPAVQLLWSTQPGSATTGAPFGQQPVLITADTNGNPSTIGLSGAIFVTVDTIPSGGLISGAQTFDIGTDPGGSNGVAVLSGLEIDTAGGYQLSASCGDGTNAVFSPTNGISNCQLWLDASDVSTFTSTNANVEDWADKSGSKNNATNVTANSIANTPLINLNANLSATAYGGQRVVSFFGTNRLNINLTSITNGPYTIIALTIFGNPAYTTPTNDYYIGTPFNNVDNTLHIGYRNATAYTFAQYADDLNYNVPGGVAPGVPLVVSHVHPNATTKNLYFNGGLVATQGGAHNLGSVLQGNIGRGNGGNYHGDMAEIIVYNTALTDLQRVGVENYLANKWLGQLSSGVASVPFVVNSPGNVVKGLQFVQQPTDTVAGSTIAPNVTVIVTNAGGGGIGNIRVALTLSSGSGTLGGTVAQLTDGTGLATFNDLSITVTGTKQLQAAIAGVATNSSQTFVISPAAESQLVLTTQPSTIATAGVAFPTQPVVAIQDAFGNVVTNSSDVITASQIFGGNLSQTSSNSVQVAAVDGIATFSGLEITNAGPSIVTFSDGALTGAFSGNIAVAANSPSSMVVQQEPSASAEVGVVFDTQPVVSVADVYGNPANNGTIVAASASPGVLLGATNVGTTGGTATYAGLSLTNLGNVTLTFSAGSVSVNSTPISVGVGPVTQAIWTTQPGSALAGAPFGQQPVLQTADAGGNISTIGLEATNMVVIAQYSGSGLAGGPLTFNIGTAGSNGVASFQNLQINTPGTSNVLTASLLGSMASPTNGIAENCILWLDASDSGTLITTNGTLSEWLDKSGNTNNATNSANYPAVGLDTSLPITGYGGQHVVKFNGSSWLDVNLSPLDNNGFTIIALEVATNIGTSGNFFIGSEYNGVDATLHVGYENPTDFRLGFYADDVDYHPTTAFSYSTPRIWSLGCDSSSRGQSIFLNGVQVASRIAAGFLNNLTTGEIGRGNGAAYTGDMAEIVVFNQSLPPADQASVEQYLTYKWLSNTRSFTVPFTVTSVTPSLSIAPGSAGNMTLTLTGAPGFMYRILATTNVAQPITSWQAIGTNTLGGSGTWQLNDARTSPMRYYRAVHP